ncbi:MAG: phenylpropionate dioxygenase-like ring-hydroxylating dioxygenase large terminal subunit [Verrucomicrobiales bacterium]|jgi:phenylpropionate dioxygenase-like ring-hydroxylating dioxygenase large terminal subunit
MLKDCWYIACQSKQLKRRPLARTIADEPVVLFRDTAGVAGCLRDRCLHRNMALSRGEVTEMGLRCSYHGWAWGRDGVCTDIPASCHDCSAYRGLKVRAYTTVEKQGFIWIWVGEGQAAGQPLDFPKFSENAWHHWVMKRVFPGNAFHCVENFLDVPHTAHVHRGWFRGTESKEVEIEITSGRDWIQADFLNEERMESVIGRLLVPKGEEIKHTDRFQLPYVTRVDYRMIESRQYIVMSQCTPVSDSETRVFTYMAYRFSPLGRLVRWGFEPLSHHILNQDVKIIRQQTADLTRTGDARFLYFETDAIAKGIRRLLDGESLADGKVERRRLKI